MPLYELRRRDYICYSLRGRKGRRLKDRYDEIGLPVTALERTDVSRAKPIEECPYPKCEECDKYHGSWCTVPIVVSKQILRLTQDKLHILEKRLTDLENLVTDEIIGL